MKYKGHVLTSEQLECLTSYYFFRSFMRIELVSSIEKSLCASGLLEMKMANYPFSFQVADRGSQEVQLYVTAKGREIVEKFCSVSLVRMCIGYKDQYTLLRAMAHVPMSQLPEFFTHADEYVRTAALQRFKSMSFGSKIRWYLSKYF